MSGNPLGFMDPDGLQIVLPPLAAPPGSAAAPIGGLPPSIDPENPYGRGVPPTPG